MKKIDINISYAKIESFSVNLESDIPTISATVGLFTENEKKISTYTVTNRKYYWEDVEFPPEIFDGLYRMLDIIERIVTNNAKSKIWLLSWKTEKSKKSEDYEDIFF